MAKRIKVATTVSPSPLPDGKSSPRVDKIFSALAKAQREVRNAVRSHRVEEGTDSYDYAGLDDVMEAIREAAGANGLAVVPIFPPGTSALQNFLVHESGQWIDFGHYPLGNPSTHKERGIAVTYARKYTTKSIFGVADEDADSEDGIGKLPLTEGIDTSAGSINVYKDGQSQSYNAKKEEYKIDCPITRDGQLNFDAFAYDLEIALINCKNMGDLSMYKKANAATLNKTERERPDLFNSLAALLEKRGNELK